MHLAELGRIERLDGGGVGGHRHSRPVHGRLGFLVEHHFLQDPVAAMKSQWFVIHTLSGQEQKVKESIEKRLKAEEMQDYIHEVLVPMEKVVDVRGGKKTVTTRKLHPGYVYIDMTLLDEDKRVIPKPFYFI